MFYVYILYSVGHDKFYIGQTQDVHRRLHEHNNMDKNTFTAKYRPWSLKAAFPVGDDRGMALKIERFIKKQKSKEFIKRLIFKQNIDSIIHKFI
jgi:putative endonuclease